MENNEVMESESQRCPIHYSYIMSSSRGTTHDACLRHKPNPAGTLPASPVAGSASFTSVSFLEVGYDYHIAYAE